MTTIHASTFPDVHIPDVSVSEHVLAPADDKPDALAIYDGAASRYSFAELREAVTRLAGGLRESGIGPGACVALMAPNMPEYAVVFHGVATAGATLTPINPTYNAQEIRFQLDDAAADMLITVPTLLDTARAAIEHSDVTRLVAIGGDGGGDVRTLAELSGDPIEQVGVDIDTDVVVLPYSSGTTGFPKGVMLTHRNLVANICQMEHVLSYREGEIGLAALPFFHIYGMQVLMNGMLANGAAVLTMARFDMGRALELIEREKVTRFFAVPPMVLGLAKAPIVDDYDISSLRQIFSGAAPLGVELQVEAAERVGCEIVQGYGMTEMSPVSHATPEGVNRPGTSGMAVSNVECRIVDPETGADQPVGERGELWVRGPMVMKGYLNNPAATDEALDVDGWLHTGDVAVLDDEGHYSIVDRIKELIKYKAFQVPPAELEALIVTHPAVSDVAVIGVPDIEAGELPKAFVVLAPGASLTLEELQSFVGEHLVSYKQIRLLEQIEAIPKSASGKILRRELRNRG